MGKVKSLRSPFIQPLELRAFILGNIVGFIICKNSSGKTGLSCSESCTGRDHLSALIESPGCRAVGSVQSSGPDKHIHIWIIKACQSALRSTQREVAPGERAAWDLTQDLVGTRIELFREPLCLLFCRKHHRSRRPPNVALTYYFAVNWPFVLLRYFCWETRLSEHMGEKCHNRLSPT